MHCDLEALLYRKMFCSQLQTNDSSEMNSFQRRVPPVTLLRFAFLCKLLSPVWLNVGASQLLLDILRNQKNWQQHHHIITRWHFQGRRTQKKKKSALDSFYWAETQWLPAWWEVWSLVCPSPPAVHHHWAQRLKPTDLTCCCITNMFECSQASCVLTGNLQSPSILSSQRKN